jgi:hypothetical protein
MVGMDEPARIGGGEVRGCARQQGGWVGHTRAGCGTSSSLYGAAVGTELRLADGWILGGGTNLGDGPIDERTRRSIAQPPGQGLVFVDTLGRLLATLG